MLFTHALGFCSCFSSRFFGPLSEGLRPRGFVPFVGALRPKTHVCDQVQREAVKQSCLQRSWSKRDVKSGYVPKPLKMMVVQYRWGHAAFLQSTVAKAKPALKHSLLCPGSNTYLERVKVSDLAHSFADPQIPIIRYLCYAVSCYTLLYYIRPYCTIS